MTGGAALTSRAEHGRLGQTLNGGSAVPAAYALSMVASASASLADPAGSSVLVAAVTWLQDTLLGSVATAVAVIAVAAVGFSMLNGRLSVRQGVTVVLGCFVLFGASTIAAGIQSFIRGDGAARSYASAPPPAVPDLPPPPPAASDPYAGASVPSR